MNAANPKPVSPGSGSQPIHPAPFVGWYLPINTLRPEQSWVVFTHAPTLKLDDAVNSKSVEDGILIKSLSESMKNWPPLVVPATEVGQLSPTQFPWLVPNESSKMVPDVSSKSQ